ncbi:3-deoxy-D-manno-octulosonic acid transferase [Streptomyces sp. NPDC005648]|uniref:3-deoxy-D-manno-octulosonic acid transferase n=1 Tax=Streptomyces sp. NPDC005648 TaxID=3157044 RepID=UPI0033A572F0
MADVVDSDELLRRLQRARACAQQEERAWRARRDELGAERSDPARDAVVRTLAYETVVRVLDEILTPGKHGGRD